ncbi:PAP2 domain protein [Pyronema omphalodes]|nr:PAP2 domain protein [Pyronema omphalodes]
MSSPVEPPLASLSLTHVYYNPNDYLSLLSAWLALLPQAMMVVYATTIFCTRELECFLMFAGQLSCELVNFVLKRVVREERPKLLHGKGYGMPSSHAQFSSYFFLYLTLLLLLRNLGGPRLPTWRRYFYVFAALVGSVSVAVSRVYLNYHTQKQVIVGYLAGLGWALIWYIAVRIGREIKVAGKTGREWALWIGGCLWVRDRCLGENLVIEGWEAAQIGEKKKL